MPDDRSRPPAWLSDRPTIRWAAYAWALVGFALAFLLLWRGLGYVRLVLAPLTLALFPAAILTPIAAWLEDHRWPPALAAFAVLFLFVAVLAGIFTLMATQIQSELTGLVDQLRTGYEQLQNRLGSFGILPEPKSLFDGVTGGNGSGGGGGDGGGSAQAAVGAARKVAELATQFFLFLVAAFFFIKDRDLIATWTLDRFPGRQRGDAAEVGAQMWRSVSSYIRGQTMIATFDGVFVAIGLLILGIPLAIVLGALVFFGAFVPVVGSIAAGTVAVGVALATEGLVPALITLAIIVGVQQFEGNVLAPYILGRELSLHPLVVLVAIIAGAALLGAWGALIAVPLTASIHRAASYIDSNHREPAAEV